MMKDIDPERVRWIPFPSTAAAWPFGANARHSSIAKQPRSTSSWIFCRVELIGRCDRPRKSDFAALLIGTIGMVALVPMPTRECAEIETDLCDPTRLILRTMRIKYPMEPADQRFQADAAFLMRARDVLNTRAAPATGLTIAFTSMVPPVAPMAGRMAPRGRTIRRARLSTVPASAHGLARSDHRMLYVLRLFSSPWPSASPLMPHGER